MMQIIVSLILFIEFINKKRKNKREICDLSVKSNINDSNSKESVFNNEFKLDKSITQNKDESNSKNKVNINLNDSNTTNEIKTKKKFICTKDFKKDCDNTNFNCKNNNYKIEVIEEITLNKANDSIIDVNFNNEINQIENKSNEKS